MESRTISMGEVKNLLNYTIDNNKLLQERGDTPIAIGLEATAGIGKTSIVEQVAAERGIPCTKLSLHQMEEPGDLIGYPEVRYEAQVAKVAKDENGKVIMRENGKPKYTVLPNLVYLTKKQLDEQVPGIKYRQTGKSKMFYAIPEWVPSYNPKGNIVILDDYVRCSNALLQACMEVILEQKYASWKLPKGTTVFLTNNPENGEFNVNSLDEAQKSRFLNYEVEFSIDAWVKWAEKKQLDSRIINFALTYADSLFNADEEGNRICNPRSYVMFANMIASIKDWDTSENLAFIKLISKGCFHDEQGRFAQMFTSFIRNKMHLLISPKQMLEGSWDTVKKKLEDTLYDSDGGYRPDIASLLERRFTGYVNAWLDSPDKSPIKVLENRIVDFIDNEKTDKLLFTRDMFFHMIKSITSDHRRQTNKLTFNPTIMSKLS